MSPRVTAPGPVGAKVSAAKFVYLSAFGGGAGSFMCWVFRYLLPGMDFDYGKWAGVGAAIGFGAALVKLVGDVLIY